MMIKKTTPKTTLEDNQTLPGTQFKGKTSTGGNQPPKKRVAINELINNMLAYSPKKNNAKVMEEYSTL